MSWCVREYLVILEAPIGEGDVLCFGEFVYASESDVSVHKPSQKIQRPHFTERGSDVNVCDLGEEGLVSQAHSAGPLIDRKNKNNHGHYK